MSLRAEWVMSLYLSGYEVIASEADMRRFALAHTAIRIIEKLWSRYQGQRRTDARSGAVDGDPASEPCVAVNHKLRFQSNGSRYDCASA